MAPTARKQLQSRVLEYAKKYGRAGESGFGFEAYVAHLFSGEEGFGTELDDHWVDDLSDRILPRDDLGVDVVLRDDNNQRMTLAQCKYSDKTPSDADLEKFIAVHARLQDKAYLTSAPGHVLELLGDYADCVADGWPVELRFVTGADIRAESRLIRVAASANRQFDQDDVRVTVKVIGRNDLSNLETDLKQMTAGLLPTVSFNIRDQKFFELRETPNGGRHALIARVSANELRNLFQQHRQLLFALNIRLPLTTRNPTKINDEIRQTAEEPSTAPDFFFFNNGVSAVCSDFILREGNAVEAKDFQIINGAQTVDALSRATSLDNVSVLFRLTASHEKVAAGSFTEKVIRYNNTQNPITDPDFKANDPIQSFLANRFGQTFSGKGALASRSFTYIAKRGQTWKSRKTLKREDFANLRHAFLHGPVASFKEPKRLWGDRYAETFGVKDNDDHWVVQDVWSDEELCEAAAAYEIWCRVITAAEDLKTEHKGSKEPPKEARYLKRLARYVTALVGAGLRAEQGKRFGTWCELVGSPTIFDKVVEPLIKESRRVLLDAYAARMESGAEVQPEYNLARDEAVWKALRERIVEQVKSGLL